MQEGIECFRIEFPKGMDVNEYALKVQPAPKSLGLSVRKALWLGKGAPRTAKAADPILGPQASAAVPSAPERRPSRGERRERSERRDGPERERAPRPSRTSSLVARAAAQPEPIPSAQLPTTQRPRRLSRCGRGRASGSFNFAAGAARRQFDLEVRGEQIEFRLGNRFFRVRG